MYYLAKVFLVCFITSVCSVFLCLVVRPYDREANCNGEQQELWPWEERGKNWWSVAGTSVFLQSLRCALPYGWDLSCVHTKSEAIFQFELLERTCEPQAFTRVKNKGQRFFPPVLAEIATVLVVGNKRRQITQRRESQCRRAFMTQLQYNFTPNFIFFLEATHKLGISRNFVLHVSISSKKLPTLSYWPTPKICFAFRVNTLQVELLSVYPEVSFLTV
jgi:hypothetical protein